MVRYIGSSSEEEHVLKNIYFRFDSSVELDGCLDMIKLPFLHKICAHHMLTFSTVCPRSSDPFYIVA